MDPPCYDGLYKKCLCCTGRTKEYFKNGIPGRLYLCCDCVLIRNVMPLMW